MVSMFYLYCMDVIKKHKVIDGHKFCRKCDNLLPVDNFRPHLKIKSGYSSWCYKCENSYIKKPPSNKKIYIKKLPSSEVVDGHKMCLKCNELLPVDKFKKNTTVKSGLHTYCLSCCVIPKKVREPKPIKVKPIREPKPIKVKEPKPIKVKEPKPIKVKEPKPIKVKEPKIKVQNIIDGHKVCNKCNELKPFDDFYKRKDNILRLDCKICCGIRNKKNKELRPKDGRHNEYQKQWKKNKREKDRVIREGNKLIKKQEKEKEVELLKIQKETNRLEKIRMIEEERLEKIRIREEYLKSDEYINRHKVCNKCNELKPFDDFHKRVNGSTLPDCKKCYNLRKTEQKKIRMETDDEYREKTRLSSMNKWNRRMSTDPLYRFRKLLSNNIRKCFKSGGYSKTSRAHEILGAEWSVIKEYFESKFTEGMSWENYGEWHIDHILPISTATCEEDVIRLNHYTNLQPLWEEDNLRKSNKMTVEGYLKEKFPYGIVSKTL